MNDRSHIHATKTPAVPRGQAELDIQGMSCASCVRRIENSLAKIHGVDDAKVNFASRTASVTYDTETTNVPDMLAAIESLGYTAQSAQIDTGEHHPSNAAGHHHANESLRDLTLRLSIAALLTLPLMVLAMSHGYIPFLNFPGHQWLQFVLATPVVFWCGWEFFRKAWAALKHKTSDMNTLIAMGAGSAYLFSAAVTIFPRFARFINPNPGHEAHAAPPVYFEAAAAIVTLILLGRYLEETARRRAGDAIRNLMKLQPTTAFVRDGATAREVTVDMIKPGDVVILKPGSSVPVDGTITSGESAVDESMLTGESTPTSKQSGARVFAGTLNLDGTLDFVAEQTGRETALARIIRLVQSAQNSKPPAARRADSISAVFVPLVVVIAILAGIAWLTLGPETQRTALALNAFVSVLIVACPCALGLATPAAIIAGVGRGAERGLLIRDATVLEQAMHLTTVVFDKTGTLTTGILRVKSIRAADTIDETTLLSLAASAESASEHPIAKALAVEANRRSLEIRKPEKFQAHGGRGIVVDVGGRQVIAGNKQFLADYDVKMTASHNDQDVATESRVWFAVDGAFAGVISFESEIRPEAQRAVARLKSLGLESIMMTGDTEDAAKPVAAAAGIQKIFAGVLPEGKAVGIKKLQEQGSIVAMTGDGINDAPALAQADIGIAMGSGTSAAMETAGITLLRSNLLAVPEAIALSRATSRTIHQNLFWAFAYNVLAIPVAAGALYPFTGWMLSPMIAGGAMAFSSLFVVLNSLRLRRIGL